LGSEFYQIPECRHILNFLEKVKSGIQISARDSHHIKTQLLLLKNLKGIAKLTCFISVLDLLASVKEFQLLATENLSLPMPMAVLPELIRFIAIC
jgi:hypothetical protein